VNFVIVGAFMDILACPLCAHRLFLSGKTLKCENGHSFDIAREGYVNLSLSGKRKTRISGDGRDMVLSRRAFLKNGHYAPLLHEIASVIISRCKNGRISHPVIIDAGCGEGYYTNNIKALVDQDGFFASVFGFDLSKDAVKMASKGSACTFAAANIFHLPVSPCCADFVLSVFSPVAESEFLRIVKPGGVLIIVSPGRRHLFEMKEALYSDPYENDDAAWEIPGFATLTKKTCLFKMHLSGSDDIINLFKMTPYSFRTAKGGEAALGALSSLDITAEFEISALVKNNLV